MGNFSSFLPGRAYKLVSLGSSYQFRGIDSRRAAMEKFMDTLFKFIIVYGLLLTVTAMLAGVAVGSLVATT
jgi:hypothetical protein